MLAQFNLEQYKHSPTIRGLIELHSKWEPHEGQQPVGRALFYHDILDIFVEAGRNWGKTDFVAYALARWAWLNPGSENYYFGPEQKQVREIMWQSQRLHKLIPRSWLAKKPNDTQMRTTYKNGSWIKCDGTDNIDSYRGVKPNKGLIIFDEFKDFHHEFFEIFDANRRGICPLIIIGTPPEMECQFTQVAQDYQTKPDKRYFHAPTSQNPFISAKWLAEKRESLYAKGEGDVWEREYMAKRIPSGRRKIFPMIDKAMIRPHAAIMNEIKKDIKKLNFYTMFDPAGATVFAVNHICLNPYSKKIYYLDEIYETDQRLMTCRQIGRRALNNEQDLVFKTDWDRRYDEAATWFANEWLENFPNEYGLIPTQKAEIKKENGLSLFKDAMLAGLVQFSDRCVKTFWEMNNYFKDDNGNIPKKDDHTIDNTRYFLHASNYKLDEDREYVETEDEDFRGRRIEDDFPHLFDEED